MTCMHQGPPPKEWNCSLERDHDGPHVARTAVGRFTWPNDAEPAGPPDALDELDRLHAAATAGEWESVLCDAPHVNDEVRMIEGPVTRANGKKFVPVISRISPRADADFIAAAKSAWPAFSARLRAAEAEVERLRGALVAKGDRVVHRLTKGRIRGTVIRVMAEVAVDGVPRPVMSPLEYDVENLEREPAARAALGET